MLWLTLAHLRQPSRAKSWALLTLGLTGALWNHVPALLWLGIGTGLYAIPVLRRRTRIDLWGVIAGALAAHAAMLWLVMSMSEGIKPIAWIMRPAPMKIFERTLALLGGPHVSTKHPHWTWIVPLAAVAGIVCSIWMTFRGSFRNRWLAARWQLVIWATFIPFLGMLAVSLTLCPVFVSRYLVFMLPGLVVLPICALSRVRLSGLAVAVSATLLIVCILSDFRLIPHRRNGMRQCVARLEKLFDTQQGDKLLVFGNSPREALKLFSERPYHSFVVPRRMPHEEGWRIFDQETAGIRRLWVIDGSAKGSLRDSPQWKQRLGKPFYRRKIGKLTLRGYHITHELKACAE